MKIEKHRGQWKSRTGIDHVILGLFGQRGDKLQRRRAWQQAAPKLPAPWPRAACSLGLLGRSNTPAERARLTTFSFFHSFFFFLPINFCRVTGTPALFLVSAWMRNSGVTGGAIWRRRGKTVPAPEYLGSAYSVLSYLLYAG